jgi:hypothetical protein
MPATAAFAPDLVLEELYPRPTLRTLGIKDIPWLPVSPILTRAFHMTPSLNSCMVRSETFLLTFFQYLFSIPPNNLPSLGGRGWRGGGTKGLYSVHPHPEPC